MVVRSSVVTVVSSRGGYTRTRFTLAAVAYTPGRVTTPTTGPFPIASKLERSRVELSSNTKGGPL